MERVNAKVNKVKTKIKTKVAKIKTKVVCYGAGMDGTVMELKTNIMELLWTLVRGSAKALVLYI